MSRKTSSFSVIQLGANQITAELEGGPGKLPVHGSSVVHMSSSYKM